MGARSLFCRISGTLDVDDGADPSDVFKVSAGSSSLFFTSQQLIDKNKRDDKQIKYGIFILYLIHFIIINISVV